MKICPIVLSKNQSYGIIKLPSKHDRKESAHGQQIKKIDKAGY